MGAIKMSGSSSRLSGLTSAICAEACASGLCCQNGHCQLELCIIVGQHGFDKEKNDVLHVKRIVMLQGACGTCPSSAGTMKMGIERALQVKQPNIPLHPMLFLSCVQVDARPLMLLCGQRHVHSALKNLALNCVEA